MLEQAHRRQQSTKQFLITESNLKMKNNLKEEKKFKKQIENFKLE